MDKRISRVRGNAAAEGFTLMELLIVIVIIAILAAIIVPVFSKVQETNRQSTSISNLHDISTKLGEYVLDNHAPPTALFGYAYNTSTPMDQDLSVVEAAANAQSAIPVDQFITDYFPGLYPVYINNINEFIDPNNDAPLNEITDSVSVSPALVTVSYAAPNVICPSGNSSVCGTAPTGYLEPVDTPTTTSDPADITMYYVADSYDISPEITGPNQIDTPAFGLQTPQPGKLVVRYQTAWTSVTSAANSSNGFTGTPDPTWFPQPSNSSCLVAGTGNYWSVMPGTDDACQVYSRQIHWQFPAASTYVTSTTYHVPNANAVMVLFEDGSVKKFSADQFMARNGGLDPGVITPVSAGVNDPTTSDANFWQITENGN